MKPSRALYIIVGAALAFATIGSFPGNAGVALFIAVICLVAALVFDFNDS